MATFLSIVLGVFFGALAGYFGGWVDAVISRMIEVIICFPRFFIFLAIIAMFKPVIESTSVGPLGVVERYVEQATLVHEFGHAVGLVNNGLPLTSEHHDAEHGAHCNNEDCVMYYQVEGASAMVDFVLNRVTSGDVVLFADDCLADAAAVE